jgi:hypothetical protein
MLLHETRDNRIRSWNFGCFTKEDKVTFIGKGKIEFSIFYLVIPPMKRNNETLYRTYQEHTINHKQIKEQLPGNTTHPSDGKKTH